MIYTKQISFNRHEISVAQLDFDLIAVILA